MSDRDVAHRTLLIPHPYEDGMAEAWIAKHTGDFGDRRTATFAMVERDRNHLCGAIGLGIDRDHNIAELGYWVGKPFWGNGYCTEAAKEVIRHGFTSLKLHRIHAAHFVRNPASGASCKSWECKPRAASDSTPQSGASMRMSCYTVC
ncbi:GNAT family N-acetyltransferase [Leptolyngbya sp. AN02str]|uniref:GNAT family N-acetyltransferase n=1 Tax=Leptolyngbya sp. AN02str TaxID=3423363 RepID=UPI003D31A0EA